MVVAKKGNRLRVLRAERDVTQMDLAQQAAISHNRYWRIENGYEQPTADECKSLAKVLKVKVDDLGLSSCQMERAS
jgi:DNA-binding XRE family transcriptional regulator